MHIETLRQLYEFVNGLEILVTPRMIRDLDEEYAKGGYSNRQNVDSLLLERYLVHEGFVTAPYHRGHDIQIGERLIDFKNVGKYHNISPTRNGFGGLPWLEKCVEAGHLTHFFLYRMLGNMPLAVGNVVWFESIEIAEADKYLFRVRPSQYNEGFYVVPEYGMIEKQLFERIE
jgi:hypothetical protein